MDSRQRRHRHRGHYRPRAAGTDGHRVRGTARRGRKVKAGEACAVVESVKTASDIYSPVSGEIIEVNPAVVDNPALVNTDPHAAAWFYKIKLSNAAN